MAFVIDCLALEFSGVSPFRLHSTRRGDAPWRGASISVAGNSAGTESALGLPERAGQVAVPGRQLDGRQAPAAFHLGAAPDDQLHHLVIAMQRNAVVRSSCSRMILPGMSFDSG